MTRLGLWGARADSGGLSAQTLEFARHMQPERVLLMDLGERGRGPADRSWYPDATVAEGCTMNDERLIARFLRDVDVLWGAETFYSARLVEMARRVGVRTILQANPELYGMDSDNPPDEVWLPTSWEADRIPGAQVVPVPVARDRLPFRLRTEAKTFLHVAAPAFHDRNGTRLLLGALRFVRNPCRVIIRGPEKTALPAAAYRSRWRHIEIVVDESTTSDYWATYPDEADVLVLPRRYGGLSLPMREAASLGMPVLTLDLEPQREWLPAESFIGAKRGRFVPMVGGRFMVHDADPRELAQRMDRLIAEPDLVEKMSRASDEWAESLSWDRLLPVYREALGVTPPDAG